MRKTHIADIFRKFVRQFTVIQKSVRTFPVILFPRSEMNLINCHGFERSFLSVHSCHIALIGPGIIVQTPDNRRALRPQFRGKRVRVRFIPYNSILSCDDKTIQIPLADTRNKQLKDAIFRTGHDVSERIPVILLSYNADAFRIWRPNDESCSFLSVLRTGMRSHFLIDLVVGSLMKQISVIFRNLHVFTSSLLYYNLK